MFRENKNPRQDFMLRPDTFKSDMALPASTKDFHALGRCPSCDSSRLEYEFRVTAEASVTRCTDCTLLFMQGDFAPKSAEQIASYIERVQERLAHLIASTGLEPHTVLVVTPPGVRASVPGCDAIASDDLVLGRAPDPPYDAAICVDVLDRIADPAALLQRIHGALTHEGIISLSVPSVSSSAARYAGPSWRGFRSGASRFYSVDTLQSALVRSGFRQAKFYSDGTMRPGSLRVRSAARVLAPLGLRGVAARAQVRARLLDEWLTVIAVRGDVVTQPRLSVIVPVYNEVATFRELMNRLVAKTIDGVDIEIIIVESNSTDGSREEVLSFATHPRVTIVLQDRANGKGNAVRAGLERATGDIMLFQDADLEYEVEDYDGLIKPLLAFQRNFVIGSRHGRDGSAWKVRDFHDAPFLTQIFNVGHLVFLALLNVLYEQSMNDPFSMFKVFRSDCLAGLTFECNRFDFDHEIVIKLIRKGYQPLEIPVNYHSRSIAQGKKVTLVRDPLTWLRAIFRYRKSDLYARPTKRGS